ncbi:MAG TPA: hypothetical protein ENK09_03440 [Nitrospirae bacterium]|nr:hypothetical protein [Nitrospirota bacterium]
MKLPVRGIGLLSVFILTVLLSGCGYRIVKSKDLTYRKIYLRYVDNLTTEPGLQDTFRTVFFEEALNHGFVQDSGGIVMDVKITNYNMRTLTVKKDRTVEYSIDILADVHLEFPDGSSRDLNRMSSEFLESFIAEKAVQSIQAQRELTTEKALRDLSQRILIELIY